VGTIGETVRALRIEAATREPLTSTDTMPD
jgi:hypothetical protein